MESTTKEPYKSKDTPLKERKILSYSALGLPLDISQANEQIKTLSPLSPLVKPFHFFVPLTTNQDPRILAFNDKEILRRQLIERQTGFGRNSSQGNHYRDGIDTKMRKEKLATTYISQAHTDIIYDF